jgi:hypothetical protein
MIRVVRDDSGQLGASLNDDNHDNDDYDDDDYGDQDDTGPGCTVLHLQSAATVEQLSATMAVRYRQTIWA